MGMGECCQGGEVRGASLQGRAVGRVWLLWNARVHIVERMCACCGVRFVQSPICMGQPN